MFREEINKNNKEYGFKIKFSKCNFFVSEVKYLGYVITKNGHQPNSEAIEAIKFMPEPSDTAELRSFLVAINFYGKFFDNMRRLRGPLDDLLKKNVKWQ